MRLTRGGWLLDVPLFVVLAPTLATIGIGGSLGAVGGAVLGMGSGTALGGVLPA